MTTVFGRRLWPLLFVLLLAVLVPTVCVLWFLAQATQNERLAIRAKLEDSYARRLADTPARMDAYWQAIIDRLSNATETAQAPSRFKSLVSDSVCDSVILYGSSEETFYPADTIQVQRTDFAIPGWNEAQHLEFISENIKAAAAYEAIASQSADSVTRAEAFQAQSRCLAKAGDRTGALTILTRTLAGKEYATVTDSSGRIINLNVQLRAIELIGAADPACSEMITRLAASLEDYTVPVPSAQRRFLMRRLLTLAPDCLPGNLLAAEDLAASYLESKPSPIQSQEFEPTSLAGIWRLASPDRLTVALFREETLRAICEKIVGSQFEKDNVEVQWIQASASETPGTLRIAQSASVLMPSREWRIVFQDPDPFAALADRRILVYFWTAGLTILTAVLLAVFLGYFITHQLRLTHLKNELLDIVSHELRTPVASMRVLVDTLLEERCRDREQELDYLRLIDRENVRLSRLLDNFLAFSRMERNRYMFDDQMFAPDALVTAAVAAIRERYTDPGCRLFVDIQPSLPEIQGDLNALTTALLNLLDNAHKYSGTEKQITVRAFVQNGYVNIEIGDNGIGLSRRATRKIFNKFYQVDRSLSRQAGGCGLGLSIVKFIVSAHGGVVTVKSELGKGSTFTIMLPVTMFPPKEKDPAP